MKHLRVGLLGTGTIGKGVWNIIEKNSENIAKRTGVMLTITQIYARNIQKAVSNGFPASILTDNYKQLIHNPEIDVIVELIGGYEPARTYILEAIAAGKKVVTANKALLAKYGNEIFEAASVKQTGIGFEAAVGGCIPVIKGISESYVADNLTSIYGILNGTTNYIITRMEEGMSYAEALKLAQDKGFAEADPTFDVEGYDAAQKVLILARLAFNSPIPDDVPVMGISQLTKNDIDYARDLGYKIKLLAMAKVSGNAVDIRVKPTMIPQKHILASVKNELNAVVLKGEQTNESILNGRGAGQLPTASVVVSDIINLGKQSNSNTYRFFNNYTLKKAEEIESRYYLRFMVDDKPGVFATLSKVLGDNNISISAVVQKEHDTDVVPVIVVTHKAINKYVQKALSEIEKLAVVKEKPFYLMIEDF